MIIAIDGSAASGKGTLAKAVAAHFGYDYLDTGALYRALALHLINAGMTPDTIDENAYARRFIYPGADPRRRTALSRYGATGFPCL